MDFDLAALEPSAGYKLLTSLVTPRPIAWVVSRDAAGALNAAPFSFFNVFSADPPMIGIGVNALAEGASKDTRRNVEATGEFTVNLVNDSVMAAMNLTAYRFAPGVSELDEAGLHEAGSSRVSVPRIAESPAALECRLDRLIELGKGNALILGRVVAIHVDDAYLLNAARQHVATAALRPVGRMHGAGWYARTSDLFELNRPTEADIAARR